MGIIYIIMGEKIEIKKDGIEFYNEEGVVEKCIQANYPTGASTDMFRLKDFDSDYFGKTLGGKLTMIYNESGFYYNAFAGYVGMSKVGGNMVALNFSGLNVNDRNFTFKIYVGEKENEWDNIYVIDFIYYYDSNTYDYHCLNENTLNICYKNSTSTVSILYISPYVGSGVGKKNFLIRSDVAISGKSVNMVDWDSTIVII